MPQPGGFSPQARVESQKTPLPNMRGTPHAVFTLRNALSRKDGEVDAGLRMLHYTVMWHFNYKEQQICALLALCSDKPQRSEQGRDRDGNKPPSFRGDTGRWGAK